MVLTELGFQRSTYEELLEWQIERAKRLFGEDIATDGKSVMGKYIRLNVEDLAECYEVLEGVYYARFPNTAIGTSLDRLGPFAGITRNAATYAVHRVLFTGTPGYTVPMGFLVGNNTLQFHTKFDYTIGEDGTTEALVTCNESGTIGNVVVGAIQDIINPDNQVVSVKHIGVETLAKDRESDQDNRARWKKSISGSGSATANAILGALYRVPQVESAVIEENDKGIQVGKLPPHSFACHVLAPDSQDKLVAEAIFSRKPLGIPSVGDINVKVQSKDGRMHDIYFSRMQKKIIYVMVTVVKNQYFEADGIEQVKKAISDNLNSLSAGETVYISTLFGFINSVPGIVNIKGLRIGVSAEDCKTEDITVATNEVAKTDAAYITVTVEG